jgi:hypothetical protein
MAELIDCRHWLVQIWILSVGFRVPSSRLCCRTIEETHLMSGKNFIGPESFGKCAQHSGASGYVQVGQFFKICP